MIERIKRRPGIYLARAAAALAIGGYAALAIEHSSSRSAVRRGQPSSYIDLTGPSESFRATGEAYFDPSISRGVICDGSKGYRIMHAGITLGGLGKDGDNNVLAFSSDFDRADLGSNALPSSTRPTVYEGVGEPLSGDYILKTGWALQQDVTNKEYDLYKFITTPTSRKLAGFNGRPVIIKGQEIAAYTNTQLQDGDLHYYQNGVTKIAVNMIQQRYGAPLVEMQIQCQQ